ncbi:inner-membrane translocator [Candidatus Vecturithrix granuli]|uniref:Inner-membrane translocator n=1 Tax=Vecturithrix granuli TaxID=1499967 RepID=A0A081C0V6_VECG1|nr:inner-membrane translocator [Candidatus Vecturithrix granuli]
METRNGNRLLLRAAGFREMGIFLFLMLMVIVISLRSPVFLTWSNLYDIALDSAILAIVAVGEMMVILTGGIDISLGSGIGLSGMIVALIIKDHWGIPPIVAVGMGTAIGAVLGAFNGLLVVKCKIPPVITTLGTMSVFRGLTFIINYAVNQGQWVGADKFSVPFKDFARGQFLFIPNLLFITALVYVIFYYLLNHTMTGRKIYAVGGNPEGARFVGINVNKITFLPYFLTGMLVGTGGVLWVSRYTSAQTDSAQGFEFMAITAVVLGGVNVTGGSGSIFGVLFGSLLIGVINNALNVVRISPFWKLALNGFIILLAVMVDKLISRKMNAVLLERRNI